MAPEQLRQYDLDKEKEFEESLLEISAHDTHNFAVDFHADEAVSMVNLKHDQIREFLGAKRPSAQSRCRWLNVWASDDEERAAIKTMLAQYGVSPRLAHLLYPYSSSQTQETDVAPPMRDRKSGIFDEINELEKASNATGQAPSSSPTVQSGNSRESQVPGLIDITKDLWHFCSLDWGRHYVCIGFNALFTTPNSRKHSLQKPDATRIWSALLLCDDGTIISMFETPRVRPEELKAIRKNQVNVFKNLSRHHAQSQLQDPMFQVDIRPMHSTSATEEGTDRFPNDNDTPQRHSEIFDSLAIASRLFYYLFDDWRATFELVSGRHHPYRNRLDALRAKMAVSAEVEDIESLHQIGRQLIVLQRVYQSYEKIVDRLLQRQRQLSADWQQQQRYLSSPSLVRQMSDGSRSDVGEAPQMTANMWITEAAGHQKTIRLPLGTIARFERLLDRIRLYALTEIEECLVEKESLVVMNFNLVNLKNAAAIEKLTRTTILLAKATILFLPVSLMTGYFSLQLEEINKLYNLQTYWLCFMVVAIFTVILLLSFNFASEKVKGKIVYQSLTRMALNLVRARGRRRHKKEI